MAAAASASLPAERTRGDRRQIVVGAEIGAAHVRVAGDLGRRADRNRSSLLEHLNAIAQFHDQGHVVLDHEDAAAKLAPDFGYRGGKLSRFLFAHASGGLIKKQIFWTGSERSRDADPSFVAIGKVCGPLQSLAGKPEEVEGFPGALPRGGAAQAHADGGQLRVLQHREIAKQAHALETFAPARGGRCEKPATR